MKFSVSFALNFLLLFSGCNALFAQAAPYLVPSVIFVGDPATLVLRLPPTAENKPDIVLTKRDYISNESAFPSNESVEINRMTFERRITGSRLLIEFTAFAPGTVELPVIEIGGEYFSGLTVNVNSLLENGSPRLLSGAASALVMPGTALMLYGSLTVLIVVILLLIWFVFRGRLVFKKLREKWRRYRLYAGMRGAEKRLGKALARGADRRVILDRLSFEFREFLSILTGKNCRSMTAGDFKREFAAEFADAPESDGPDESVFLGKFFDRCDKLRFSGTDIDSADIEKLLGDLREFMEAKNREEKIK